MEREITDSLRQFLSAQKRLNELGVISSRDYLGDIGCYLCQLTYGLEVPQGGEPSGYDGTIGGLRVAVSFNDFPAGTPVRVDEPLDFDELIVVLGPNCPLEAGGRGQRFYLLPVHP